VSRVSIIRWWLPIGICAVGVVMLVVALIKQDDIWGEGGGLVISAGLSVWLLNALYRVGVRGDRERDREAEAREYFDEHGRWPDEEGPSRRDG
jgi:hypothetical protein